MRIWAIFCEPVPYGGRKLQKIMLYEKPNGETCAFLYENADAQICCADECYSNLAEALIRWDGERHTNWTALDDPLPGCQEDAMLPVRVRGRDRGEPQWGSYEVWIDGAWTPYREA